MAFNYFNKIVQADLKRMASKLFFKESFEDKTVLVTGATGMLATYVTYLLCYLHKTCRVNVKVLALCRTKSKADTLYAYFYDEEWFILLNQDVCDPIVYENRVDYIFHLAGNASPFYIKNDPVGILKSNLLGTFNILEYARKKHMKKVLFVSTREVYGNNENVAFLTEKDFGSLDCLEARSCYPESKRAAETMFRSYYLQYSIPFNVVRVAHSYGPGMNLKNDGRIMADLISNVVNGEDVLLKSDGKAERAFCYITDAVYAMFLVLVKGELGMAYNIANELEPITIYNLAKYLADLGHLNVVFNTSRVQSNVYCNYKRSGLNCSAIKSLGWKPEVKLNEGLIYTLSSFK